MPGPLSYIRVLDLSRVLAGPWASQPRRSIHFLCASDNGGYFEGDVSEANRFRDARCGARPGVLDREGCVRPLEAPGLGLEVDEAFLAAHPPIEGPGYS